MEIIFEDPPNWRAGRGTVGSVFRFMASVFPAGGVVADIFQGLCFRWTYAVPPKHELTWPCWQTSSSGMAQRVAKGGGAKGGAVAGSQCCNESPTSRQP